MARQTKEQKRISQEVEAAFNQHGCNIQFDMMDLGKIIKAGEDAASKGESIVDAVKAAIQQYRKN